VSTENISKICGVTVLLLLSPKHNGTFKSIYERAEIVSVLILYRTNFLTNNIASCFVGNENIPFASWLNLQCIIHYFSIESVHGRFLVASQGIMPVQFF
jgi:hypothetical protein